MSQDLLKKLEALKARGIFQCRLPDVLVGSLLARVDHTNPEEVVFQIGELHQTTAGATVTAGWILAYGSRGRLVVTDDSRAFHILGALDKYNSILDDLMAIADNGLLQ